MPVFKIGVMVLTLEGERRAVILGRLFDPRSHAKGPEEDLSVRGGTRRDTENCFLSAEDAEGRGELQNSFFIHEGPRRDTKDTFLSVENCFFVRGGARRTSREYRVFFGQLRGPAQPRLRLQSYT